MTEKALPFVNALASIRITLRKCSAAIRDERQRGRKARANDQAPWQRLE
jgi:hypothetical protein